MNGPNPELIKDFSEAQKLTDEKNITSLLKDMK